MIEAAVTVNVPAQEGRRYPIYITDHYRDLASVLSSERIFLFSQKGLEDQLLEFFAETKLSRDRVYFLEQGEENKHITQTRPVYNWLIDQGIDRHSTIVAFGGGVVGDFAGFIAATILRGVKFVQVPTTLLASVDSSVGGKVAVNADSGKNMIGQFFHPALVYCNVSIFATLPDSEWACGFAEMVKHGFLEESGRVLDFLESNAERIRQKEILTKAIADSVSFKASIVSQDEKETGLRSILNLGHTTAHAIESVTEYKRFSHGQAVARGLVTAILISQKRGLSNAKAERMLSVMKSLGLPMDTAGFSAPELFEHMKFDKKNSGSQIRFVLLEDSGVVFGIPVLREEFARAWQEQKERFG
jgi:3-dehydroquinate synthase